MEAFLQVVSVFSQWAIPLVILIIIVGGAVKRVPMYESFVTGAKEGFSVAVMIIPYLVAILFIIKIFVASGAFEDIKLVVGWMMEQIGLGQYRESLDLIPLALTKPLTGSGARGVMLEIFDVHGPDSFLGKTASIMMGSTETTFYILTVYYGSIQVKKLRHTLPACLIADCAGIAAAVVLGYFMYG
ncbi:MAG: spore maturation protein [Planctomycetales bacterium]|nr:spore maturation protein [Planctomycetales bacterium]